MEPNMSIVKTHLRVGKFCAEAFAHEVGIGVEVHGEAVLYACYQLSLHFKIYL